MLKEYTISEILELPLNLVPYYIGTFEGTDDPDIEWPHRHAFYSVVWFTGGEGFYVVDFQEYEIKPNRIFLVNPRQVHNWDYSENSRGFVLMVDATLALELKIESFVPYLDIKETLLIEGVFNHLLNESQKNDDIAGRNIKAGITYLYALLERLSNRQAAAHEPQNTLIEKLNRLVFDSPQLLTVGDCADKLHVSDDNLNAVIKSATGKSAKQYLLDLKMIEAKRLLIYSLDNINEIGFQLGFEDSSYFSRIFRKKTGLSPRAFLEKYRKDSRKS